MSVGRFAGYFLALVVCATAAFSSLPDSADAPRYDAPPSFSGQTDRPAQLPRPMQVALAR